MDALWRVRQLGVVLGVLALVLAACGSPAVDSPTPTQPAPATPAPSGPSPNPPTPTPVPTFDVAEYYRGKTISYIVGYPPGGAYDIQGRAVSLHMPKYIPGNPRVIVQNRPGGGGLLGAQVILRSNPDGLTIGDINPRQIMRPIVGIDEGINIQELMFLGLPSASTLDRIYCVNRNVADSWDAVLNMGRTITDGDTQPGGSSGMGAWFIENLGGPIRIVFGYDGTADVMAAFNRGELDGTNRCSERDVRNLYPEWIDQQILVPLFWYEAQPTDAWLEEIGAPGQPPHVFDVPGINPTEAQKTAFNTAMGMVSLSRIVHVTPGTPDPIYRALEAAMEQTAHDPDFGASLVAAGIAPGWFSAEEAAILIRDGTTLAPDGMEMFVKLVSP